jgi:Ca-activated chloride channel homolog
MSWTSIAVGADADQALLRSMASRAKGNFHWCETGDQVPKVFIEQAKAIQRVAELKQAPFRPLPGPDGSLYHGPAISKMPELNGMIPSSIRPGAEVLLLGKDNTPLLSSWQFGLGRVSAFTSDAKVVWGEHWIQWPQFGEFWVAAVRTVMRPPQTYNTRVRSRISGNEGRFIFQVRDKDNRPVNGLLGKAIIQQDEPSGANSKSTATVSSSDVTWKQTNLGEYEASVALPANQMNNTLLMSLESADRSILHYAASLSGRTDAELSATGIDLESAAAIATAGSGIVSSDPQELSGFFGKSISRAVTTPVSVWPWLIMTALCFWPIDLLMRKFV